MLWPRARNFRQNNKARISEMNLFIQNVELGCEMVNVYEDTCQTCRGLGGL